MMLRRLINSGVSSDIDQSLARKVRIVNLASLLTVGLFSFFMIVLIVKARWFHASIYLAFALAFFLPVIINQLRRYLIARSVLLSLLAIGLVAVECIISSNSRGIFIICLLLLGVFLSDSRKETVLVYGFVVCVFMLIRTVPSMFVRGPIVHESEFAFWFNLIIGVLGMYAMVNTFIADGWKYERQLTDANAELEKQWAEAEEQRSTAIRQSEMMARTNAEMKALNNDLLDGIRYARRIQNSMLVPKEKIQELLPEMLLYYKPKDVLSGDFYWFAESDEFLFVAAADCTGHGVPGALMTVMGNNLLHQIVTRDGILLPSTILSELDRRVTELLTQRITAADVVNDGMDMVLVRIHRPTGRMLFSSAKRPLYAFHGNSGELTEYPASKQSIGGHRTEGKSFTDVEIPASPNDTFYMTSDGFTDQFGPEGKFLPKRFRQLLRDIHRLPMPEQHRALNETLLRWRLREPQTDDVLIFGFRTTGSMPC